MDREIVVFSDVHYSKNWDTIEKCLIKRQSSTHSFLNPNKELRHFIRRVNKSSTTGLVINNGDSVDYHFDDYSALKNLLKQKPNSRRTSNWDHFNLDLQCLNKPYIAILGNHDYRKEAYNYNFWGTDHVNLSSRERKKYKNEIGHHAFRGPFELLSIMVNNKKFNPLKKCLGYKKRRHFIFGKYHCIFLNNGTDAFVKLRNIFKYIDKNLMPPILSYDLDGLKKKDLAYVSSCLSQMTGDHFLIFQHAPIINSKTVNLNKEYQLSTNLFRKSTVKQNISYNTILNGGGRLLNILRKTAGNVTIVCSHTHASKYFLIDKSSLAAKEVSAGDFNFEKNNPSYIKQVTTLPLGVIHKIEGGFKTGFLKINDQGFKEVVLKIFNK